MQKSSRRKFIEKATLSTIGFMGISTAIKANLFANTQNANSLNDNFPAQDPKLVQEIVGASHGQLEKVKELLAAHPELAKATWDWGYGDWETALGAASHVGNKEIAELLMANGARPDIFTLVMLGNLNAVKAMIEANPGVQKILGPHGITLMAHAKIRLGNKSLNEDEKKKMQAMVDYLSSVGDADIKAVSLETTEADKKKYAGTYSYGSGAEDSLTVEINARGVLGIKKGQQFPRGLNRVSEHSFAPVGAQHVIIQFEIKGAQAVSLKILDPMLLVEAVRK